MQQEEELELIGQNKNRTLMLIKPPHSYIYSVSQGIFDFVLKRISEIYPYIDEKDTRTGVFIANNNFLYDFYSHLAGKWSGLQDMIDDFTNKPFIAVTFPIRQDLVNKVKEMTGKTNNEQDEKTFRGYARKRYNDFREIRGERFKTRTGICLPELTKTWQNGVHISDSDGLEHDLDVVERYLLFTDC
ncbi:MAG: hypothetical protein ACP5D2_03560 [Candidatus Nanoarchaeia archaeon]